eukprot:gene29296-38369_t
MGLRSFFFDIFCRPYEYILASRPWSFTAAIIPILLTTAVLKQSFFSIAFARVLAMGVFIQAGANLSNTYFDFKSGVDSLKFPCGDRVLVDKKIEPVNLLLFSVVCYISGIGSIISLLITGQTEGNQMLLATFITGVLVAFFYTAQPFALKYTAMGDIAIFFSFGPLLMQATSIILVGKMDDSLYFYAIPIGFLTEAILHANNSRDIKADTVNGIKTLANLVGLRLSFAIYIALIIGAYLTSIFISICFHWGCMLSFITLPLAVNAVKQFHSNNLSQLDQETAKMHLPFGLLLVIGVLITPSGLI